MLDGHEGWLIQSVCLASTTNTTEGAALRVVPLVILGECNTF